MIDGVKRKADERLQARVFIPVLLVAVALLGSAFAGFSAYQRNLLHREIRVRAQECESLLYDHIDKDATFLLSATEFIAADPQLRAAWLARDRERFKALASPVFDHLKRRYGVTHFYVVTPERQCFLRVHNLSTFGDAITHFTVAEAARTGRTAYGLELGKYGVFTLRVVSPWVIDGKVAGYIELGEEPNYLTPEIQRTLGVKVFMVVKKALIDRRNWAEGLKIFGLAGDWGLLADAVMIDVDGGRCDPAMAAMVERLQADVASRPLGEPMVVGGRSGGKDYVASALPLKDVAGKQVGALVVLRDVSSQAAGLRSLMLSLAGLAALGLLLLFVLFHRHISRIERRIVKARVALEAEVVEREVAELQARRAQEEAERAGKARTNFLAAMSHEIRTPMNGVIGMTGLLLNTELSREQREYVETIRVSGDSLLTIINDILDFSKMDSGKLELESQPFALVNCVEESYDLLSPLAEAKAVELLYQVAPDVPEYVESDLTRLRQVLVNLVGNSLKFTGPGEVLTTVSLRSADGDDVELEFAVKDNGQGIPAGKMDQLFKPFSQIYMAKHHKPGGTGLGLAICRHLVELLGGAIRAESDGEGRGATFSFTIKTRRCAAPPDATAAYQAALVGLKVLLVDDNPTNRMILSGECSQWGMVPTAATSAEEALELLRSGKVFDVGLLDLILPGMDGVALAREIRLLPDGAKLPLVLLSSGGKLQELRGLDGVFKACLAKPLKQAQLLKVLLQVLGVELPEPHAVANRPPPHVIDKTLGGRLPLRLLVAEDNIVNQKVAVRILSKLGYLADVAGNGLEAVECVERQPYDIVFMDVQMPDLDGLEATREIISRHPQGGRPVIIAMTADAIDEDRAECAKAGMDDFISKPVRISEIQAAIERWGGVVHARRNA